MNRILGTLAALLAFFPSSGCGPDARYCSKCETAVTQSESDGRARLIRGRCTVNGKEIDCTHEYSRCPECKSHK